MFFNLFVLTFGQIESDIIPKPSDFGRRSRSCRSAGERHLHNHPREDHDHDVDYDEDREKDIIARTALLLAIMTKRREGNALSV